MGNHGVLGPAGGVQTGSADEGEPVGQTEMIQNAAGEGLRLGGGEGDRSPLRAKSGQKLGNAGVDPAFKQTAIPVVLPVEGDGAVGVRFRKTQNAPEGDGPYLNNQDIQKE